PAPLRAAPPTPVPRKAISAIPRPPCGGYGEICPPMISVPNANWTDTMYDPYKQCQYFLRQLLRWFALYRIIKIECK
ncbi:MAG: hypothetical protein RR865_11905, partial [Clostridia bacterium]